MAGPNGRWVDGPSLKGLWGKKNLHVKSVSGWTNPLEKYYYIVHPQRFTWNLKMMVSNRNLLFQWLIFRFHVKLQGCSQNWIKWPQGSAWKFKKSLKNTSKSKDEFPNFSSLLFIFGSSFFGGEGGDLKVWNISISAIAAWHALPFTMAQNASRFRGSSEKSEIRVVRQFAVSEILGVVDVPSYRNKKKRTPQVTVFSSNVGNNLLTCLFFWTPRKGLLNCSSPCFYRPFWTKV